MENQTKEATTEKVKKEQETEVKHQSRSTGLPKLAVEKLRAWFDQHFEYPYPNEREKTILASETGLTITQVLVIFF